MQIQPETHIPNCHVNPHSGICRHMLLVRDLKYTRPWLLDLIYMENLHHSGITFPLPWLWAGKRIVLENSRHVSGIASGKLRHNWPSAELRFLPAPLLLNPPNSKIKWCLCSQQKESGWARRAMWDLNLGFSSRLLRQTRVWLRAPAAR